MIFKERIYRRRNLVIDDNLSIHDNFKKVLAKRKKPTRQLWCCLLNDTDIPGSCSNLG
jgi:hypothetical protein